jgi:hypothetical protein
MKRTSQYNVIKFIKDNKIIINTTDIHGSDPDSDLNIIHFLLRELDPETVYKSIPKKRADGLYGIRIFTDPVYSLSGSGYGSVKGYEAQKCKIRTLGSLLKLEEL